MKALSVKQPWAGLIAAGKKTIELRSWRTSHRGPLLIVSSLRPTGEGPTGVGLCIVDLLDCRPMVIADATAACSDYDDGIYSWVLGPPKLIVMRPISGRLRLFEVADELISTAAVSPSACL